MLNHPIETVIFDLDGTLRHNLPSSDDVQYELALKLGVTDTPGRQHKGTRWSHYYWAQSAELFADMDQFGEMGDDFWTHYAFRYLMSLTVPEAGARSMAPKLFQGMQNGFNPENHIYPCVPETLEAISGNGFVVGLVSNRSKPCQEECEQLGLLSYFDFAYVAAEVDAWKPDPRIFDRALEISGSPPERTIYIGDNYFADILGAQSAGLQPVLLDPKGLFPEATCTVIDTIGDLKAMLV